MCVFSDLTKIDIKIMYIDWPNTISDFDYKYQIVNHIKPGYFNGIVEDCRL